MSIRHNSRTQVLPNGLAFTWFVSPALQYCLANKLVFLRKIHFETEQVYELPLSQILSEPSGEPLRVEV